MADIVMYPNQGNFTLYPSLYFSKYFSFYIYLFIINYLFFKICIRTSVSENDT